MLDTDNLSHGAKTAEGLQGSLKKLNLDYIDLYLVHFPIDSTGAESKPDFVDVSLSNSVYIDKTLTCN